MSLVPRYRNRNHEWIDRLLGLALAGLLLLIFVAIILVPSLLHASELQTVPYPLHSVLQADYSTDLMNLQHARLELAVIAQVIQDQRPPLNGGDTSLIELGLGIPVPTVTLYPGLLTPSGSDFPSYNATPTGGASSTPTFLVTPTHTGTNLPEQTPIIDLNTPTATQSVDTQPNVTPPARTRTPRATPQPGVTQLPSATFAPTLEPAATNPPPANTSQATPTPRPIIPTPEPTQPPPPTKPPDSYPPPAPPPNPYP